MGISEQIAHGSKQPLLLSMDCYDLSRYRRNKVVVTAAFAVGES